MATRTDENTVRSTLGNDYDRKTSLLRFIKQANVQVNNLVAFVARYRPEFALDSATLLEVETLLACHKYQMQDPGYSQRATSQASGQFMVQKGDGLERTNYGREAIAMDFTGVLNAMDKRQVAGGFWAGREEDSADDDEVNGTSVEDS